MLFQEPPTNSKEYFIGQKWLCYKWKQYKRPI